MKSLPTDSKNKHPHRSTTHEERYVHIHQSVGKFKGATLFFRKETKESPWAVSMALCSQHDQFNKKIGRTISRRRYFLMRDSKEGLATLHIDAKPTYELAEDFYFQFAKPQV